MEDERELLTALGNLLVDQGYNVISLASAESALKELDGKPIDIIIADIKLPGIDGFDFFEKVRQVKQYAQIPFVFLTAYNNLSAKAFAKKHGAVEYITKPFDFEYLVARIKQIVPL